MLMNTTHVKEADIATITRTMNESAFEIWLTGRRLFSDRGPSSDWDFFTQDEGQIEEFLWALGFKSISDSRYTFSDSNVAKVYRRFLDSGSWIDIQLVKDRNVKIAAQELLKKTFPHWGDAEKQCDKHLWKLAYEAVKDK